MITFKRLQYKNFLSTGNQPIVVNLDMSQTTLIVGTNGSGKSTLLDALCFVLFNKPFRIIKKDQMVNTINAGDCMVEVDFEVGTKKYKIRRGIKPNIFEIFQNGTLLNQDASTIDYQKYLEQNIMKLNYRSFIQVVLLGSSSYEPFMKMKPRYRREVVEEILDIRVFGLMDLILRSQQSDLQKKLTEVRHQCELIKSKYETEAKYLKSLEDQGTDFQTGKQKSLEKNRQSETEYREKIKQLNIEIESTNSLLVDKDKVKGQYNQLTKLEGKIENNLSNHQKTLDFFLNNDNCPTCTQPIEEEFKSKKKIEETTTIQKLETGLEELLQEITKTEEKVTEMSGVSKKVQDLNVEVAKIETSLQALKTSSDSIIRASI